MDKTASGCALLIAIYPEDVIVVHLGSTKLHLTSLRFSFLLYIILDSRASRIFRARGDKRKNGGEIYRL